MILKNLLEQIESTVNSKPCGYCGLQHHFSLSLAGNAGDVVCIRFSDDSCEDFKFAAKQFAAKMLNDYGLSVTII